MSRASVADEAAEPRGPHQAVRRVVLVADPGRDWTDIVGSLQSDGIEVDRIPVRAAPADLIGSLKRDDAVVVVDLAANPADGLTMVSTCRRLARLTPCIVVAVNPSMDLVRSIRQSGAFYLALDPVSLDEMRSALQSAFACLESRRASSSTLRARRRVLIVDDDPDFVASTTALLSANGYDVSTATSGRQGLEKLLEDHPDLVLLDVMMEDDWAGYSVNQAVKFSERFACVRHVPILMVSSIPVDPATRFRMAGEVDMVTPNAYLTKPLDIGRFLAEIAVLLGETRDENTAGGV
jgi:two-component system alkaline phosphatase synthesis response regulator PhoP